MAEPRGQEAGAPDAEERPAGAEQVEELLRSLASTVRSYRLYAGNGPMLERFVAALTERVRAAWEVVDRIRLEISEGAMFWEGEKVFPTGDGSGELPFLFYKDGIRAITLLPGVEEEVPAILGVLGRAPHLREEEDDLVTLLWQENLTAFQYESVDLPVDGGAEIVAASGAAPKQIDPRAVRDAAAPAHESPGLGTEDFRETLYFLDAADLRRLAEEVIREQERDVWQDVLNALLDRLEDGDVDRQTRIVALLEELLPSMLATGAYDRAARLLDDLSRLATREVPLPPPVLQRIRAVFGQLASPEALAQLAQVLEDPAQPAQSAALEQLFAFFPPQALAPLTALLETVVRPDARRQLTAAAERLAESNREQVVRLLPSPDPAVVRGALRWVGALGIGSAANEVIGLLRHESPQVRAAAAEAAAALRAAVAGPSLVLLLDDAEREVRLSAVKALASLEHAAARPALEAAIQGRRLRAADRTEKLAYFEALGRVGGSDAVPFLDKLLNSRSWLGRGESSEVRACAAIGLGRVRHPAARQALQRAASDGDPVVRTAVNRSLREGAGT